MTKTRAVAGTMLLALTTICAQFTPAGATEGSLPLAPGVAQRATGGAGVAHGNDAMAVALNPALSAAVGHEFQLGVELFSPQRGYTGTGTGFVAPGDIRSGRNLFLVPNMAYNRPIDANSAINIAFYGAGGGNTDYGNPPGAAGCMGGSGVFCFGPAGSDLIQAQLSFTYARKAGAVSFGISPTLAFQAFEAHGIAPFAGLSVSPGNVSDRGYAFSVGAGLRAGVAIDVTESLRFGLAGQTPMWMTRMSKYGGLLEDGGAMNIPAHVTAGLAWDVRPDLTLMLDYQHVFYSTVPAISNSSTAGPLGARGGAGFGWDDVDVVKAGIEWRQNDTMTWRAGYAFATNPVGPEDITFGILAPGIARHHVTAGGSYRVSETSSVDFGLLYAFSNAVTGAVPAAFGGGNVTLEMHQFSASVGWRKSF